MLRYEMRGEIWVYPGKGGWHFVTLPADFAARIKMAMTGLARPWSSLGVTVVIGKTRWRTSLFPDKASAACCCRSSLQYGSKRTSRPATRRR